MYRYKHFAMLLSDQCCKCNLFIPYFSHVAENLQKHPFNIWMRFFKTHLKANIFVRATTFLSTLAVCNIFVTRQLKNTAARKMLSRQAAR